MVSGDARNSPRNTQPQCILGLCAYLCDFFLDLSLELKELPIAICDCCISVESHNSGYSIALRFGPALASAMGNRYSNLRLRFLMPFRLLPDVVPLYTSSSGIATQPRPGA